MLIHYKPVYATVRHASAFEFAVDPFPRGILGGVVDRDYRLCWFHARIKESDLDGLCATTIPHKMRNFVITLIRPTIDRQCTNRLARGRCWSVAMLMIEKKLAAIDASNIRAAQLSRELAGVNKKLRGCAQTGNVQELRRVVADFTRVTEGLHALASEMAALLDFDERDYFGSERFLDEVEEAARAAGVRTSRGEGVLYSYPVAVKVSQQHNSLLLGKRREFRIRPVFVAQQLKKLQDETGRIPEATFLEVLYAGYKLLVTDQESGLARLGKVVPLIEIYEALTLLPQVARGYTRHDFGVDIYRLDRSRLQKTKDGAMFTLPASTGTRTGNRTLSVITEAGQEVRYFAIAFNENPSRTNRPNDSLA